MKGGAIFFFFVCLLLLLLFPPTTHSHSLRKRLKEEDNIKKKNPCDLFSTFPVPLQTLRSYQVTVLINGYSSSRIPLILSAAAAYAASPLVSSVLVLWGNPSTPPRTLSHLSRNLSLVAPHISFHPHKSSSLNSRFLPRPNSIHTRAVLVCDDDIEVDHYTLEFAFRIWQQTPNRLIGLFTRSHDLDLTRKTWIYTVHPNKYSIVLTKFMIMKADYLYSYTCRDEYREARRLVDRWRNCEDILMNFVVATETETEIDGEWGPAAVMVAARRVRDRGDARNDDESADGVGETKVGLSGIERGRGEHRKRRGECITEFHRLLGRMPLRFSYGKVGDDIGEQGLCHKAGRLVPCDHQI